MHIVLDVCSKCSEHIVLCRLINVALHFTADDDIYFNISSGSYNTPVLSPSVSSSQFENFIPAYKNHSIWRVYPHAARCCKAQYII